MVLYELQILNLSPAGKTKRSLGELSHPNLNRKAQLQHFLTKIKRPFTEVRGSSFKLSANQPVLQYQKLTQSKYFNL